MKKISELNESLQNKYDNPLNLPPVENLGDGVYEGALWGHCFYFYNKHIAESVTKQGKHAILNAYHSISLTNSNILN